MKMPLAVLLILLLGSPALAGVAVYVAPQVSPATVTVYGVNGPETRNAPIPPVTMPDTHVVRLCQTPGFSRYSSADARRSEVWRTIAATGDASTTLFAVCPQMRDLKRAEIRAEGDRRMKAMAHPYLDGERQTWFVQVQEAYHPDEPTPMIDGIAAGRGVTRDCAIAEIKAMDAALRTAEGAVLGEQLFLLDWTDREQDFETLSNITWQ